MEVLQACFYDPILHGKKKKKKGTKLLDQSFESPSPGQGEGKGLEVWKQQGGHAPHSHG